MHPKRDDEGTTQADAGRPSLAMLPYEIQAAIFDAALDPQIFFMEIRSNMLAFSRPADKGLALACRLSRARYLKNKRLCEFGTQSHWVDPERDIFYLYKDDPVPRMERIETPHLRPAQGESYDQQIIKNVAVDLQYLGVHPRQDPVRRIWSLFPSLTTIRVFIPKAPLWTPALTATPDTLLLSPIPNMLIVAAPGLDKELWLAVRYQVKKACTRILEISNGWHGRHIPEVLGHWTSLRGAKPLEVPEGPEAG